jgi:hypothetical protein
MSRNQANNRATRPTGATSKKGAAEHTAPIRLNPVLETKDLGGLGVVTDQRAAVADAEAELSARRCRPRRR